MSKTIKIKMEDSNTILLTEEEYEAVAAYVRNQDRLDYAHDVLCNNLSCIDERKSNLETYLMRPQNLAAFAIKLDEAINGNTGETECECVDEAVEALEPGIYCIISNKGTENEQQDKVILPAALAHEIEEGISDTKEFSVISVYNIEGEKLDPLFFSSIKYVGEYED